MYKDLI